MLSKLNQTKIIEMSQKTKKQKGASMIEYALVVAGVAAIAAAVFSTTGGSSFETKVQAKLDSAIGS